MLVGEKYSRLHIGALPMVWSSFSLRAFEKTLFYSGVSGLRGQGTPHQKCCGWFVTDPDLFLGRNRDSASEELELHWVGTGMQELLTLRTF